jgi:hypothetical protein
VGRVREGKERRGGEGGRGPVSAHAWAWEKEKAGQLGCAREKEGKGERDGPAQGGEREKDYN